MNPEDEKYLEKRLERFKQDLDLEQTQRRVDRYRKLLDQLPWLVAGGLGWILFFFSISHK
jgi:hypothetical protein